MARSQKDDPVFNNMQHHWNFCSDDQETCSAANINDRNSQPVLNDNTFVNQNPYSANDVYIKKHPFNVNVHSSDTATDKDENIAYNNVPNVNISNNFQSYGVLNFGNGQMVRVFYDGNNRQLMIPVTSQYELFSNQGYREGSLQPNRSSQLFNVPQETLVNNNINTVQASLPTQNGGYRHDNTNNSSNAPTMSFLNEVLGNWEPNATGTYSPFGQNYPLNHPEVPVHTVHPTSNNNIIESNVTPNVTRQNTTSPKRSDNSPLADNTKKRIVAEVKPMRPTYSDVLAKNTKNVNASDILRKTKTPTNVDSKQVNKANGTKIDKPITQSPKINNEENKPKQEKKNFNNMSSGSESGEINSLDSDKSQKISKKNKTKHSNMSRKWSSLDDIINEEDMNFINEENNKSQFIFIENHNEKNIKKDKKAHDQKVKVNDKSSGEYEESYDNDDKSESAYQENQNDNIKTKKKKDNRNYGHKTSKVNQDKKKSTQTKLKRNKPGYLGLAQNYLEHWGGATWKALIWFLYLLSDVCRMSAHLSFDLCASIFTQTYISSQAVWRSSKDWLSKLKDNKLLLYVDRKFGHTRFAFWRRLKWFNKDIESDSGNDSKLNANIPLPGTGEEAMKRLLACKGKDPYSILGVSEVCTDEEIKRYYRRQAFLVHPDKNQQPGAEEAFKILQHAFDLIGEPERREAYDRRTLESRHVEAAWGELSQLLAQLHDKMEFAANTIRCTNCGRRHKRVLTDRPCYAARYCAQCKIRHSAKEGDIWAESGFMGMLVMYYACMDGAVYQITQWASCQKKNLKQLRPDCHVVQYRIVLGSRAAAAHDLGPRPPNRSCLYSNFKGQTSYGHDPNLEEFLNNLYKSSSGNSTSSSSAKPAPNDASDGKAKRRNKKPKV
ncbi:DnaJ homolog subfamily C member 14 [Eumeta japonica]|uniref:DnaJ homolog subfamily C member 14 n=1 Tax=Eumeta variegata TaxID=151549 RepID=A0A4C1TAE7_EUMVA|nr:DnaJ homolog subfamily C member 14 [Eumeta japonica]